MFMKGSRLGEAKLQISVPKELLGASDIVWGQEVCEEEARGMRANCNSALGDFCRLHFQRGSVCSLTSYG